jgi:hypothetical protein
MEGFMGCTQTNGERGTDGCIGVHVTRKDAWVFACPAQAQ